MKITNKSTKIIHIGEVTILPDKAEEVKDSLRKNPAVAMLVARGDIEIGGGKATGKAAKSSRKGAGKSADQEPTEDQAGSTGSQTGENSGQ